MELSFKETIKEDLIFFRRKFYSQSKTDVTLITCIKYLIVPCYAVVFWYRVYSRLVTSKHRLIRLVGAILYYRYSRKYSSDIHPKSKIGVPFKVGHHFGVVIGPEVVIGSGVYIFNDVTLGNKNVGLEDIMPSLGDNIIVGAGSKLLGGIKVGSNSIIGANSVLVSDVGENEIWAGSPAKFIKQNNQPSPIEFVF